MFKDKTLLVTGGTGSFGNALVKRFISSDLKEIRVFSRDEKKQDFMRKKFNNNKLTFYLGDIRDSAAIKSALIDVDFIFHAAALKQVPSCEFFPLEAVKTNVIGTANLIHEARNKAVEKIVILSTDKAVYPINAMGISKAMMEKIMIAESMKPNNSDLTICGTRYGNVMGSRGSVIPLFIDQIQKRKPITITDGNMTRFMMSLESSIDLVLHAFKFGNNGDIFIHKAPSASINTLLKAILEIAEKPNYPIEIIGKRHGEKMFESLMSSEECSKAEDMGNFFRIIPDTRDLNYSLYFEKGDSFKGRELDLVDYNSHNVKLLSVKEMKSLLINLDLVKDFQKNIKK